MFLFPFFNDRLNARTDKCDTHYQPACYHLDLKNRVNKVDYQSSQDHHGSPVIDMMECIWGKEAVILFCEINAFKYRMRAGHKNDAEQDIMKEQWYLNKAEELKRM